jgi:transposase
MKKRIYRAVSVKSLNREKLAELVKGHRVVFGVDVAKEDFVGAFMNEGREIIQTIKWKSPGEVADIVTLLKELPTSTLEVAMEPSGTYGDTLRAFLEKEGFSVYLVSPKKTFDASEVYDGVPSSHDAKSAAIIAKLHWDGASKEWPRRSDEVRRLAAAVETMELYSGQLSRNINRMESKLARYWPEVTTIIGIDSATLLALLGAYGGPEAIAADTEGARRLMVRVGRTMLSSEKRESVIEAARTTIGVNMIEGERELIKELALETDRNRKATNEARRKVERMSQGDKALALMSSTVGRVTAAVLMVTSGDPNMYPSAGAYLKGNGLNLKERSSGKHKGKLKITKRGPGAARNYLYMAALRLIQRDEVCNAWYQKKVVRDGGKIKNKAITALMRKLVKALWRVARGEAFDSRKLFDTSRLSLATN